MATVWVECWKCEACGHRWIKTELYPAQCAKCRSRRWNGPSAGVPIVTRDIKSEALTPDQIPISVAESAKISGTTSTPVDMEALRDICAGNIPTDPSINLHSSTGGTMYSKSYVEHAEIPICGKTWWEEGEQYECLMDKGHKYPKHGMSGMVRVIS